jgi:hypothetical protein
MIAPEAGLSVIRQCALLGIARSSKREAGDVNRFGDLRREEEPKVCGLSAGGEWIRTIGPRSMFGYGPDRTAGRAWIHATCRTTPGH